jgi:hypothetical protein
LEVNLKQNIETKILPEFYLITFTISSAEKRNRPVVQWHSFFALFIQIRQYLENQGNSYAQRSFPCQTGF